MTNLEELKAAHDFAHDAAHDTAYASRVATANAACTAARRLMLLGMLIMILS